MRFVAKRVFMSIIAAILVVSMLPSAAFAGKEELEGLTLQKEMQAMIDQGIIQGFDDGMYYPRKTVTRGQFATFLMRALELEEAKGSFPDVAESSALAKGIYAASAAGLMNGYSDGRFGPYDEINREQLAIVVENVLTKLNMKSDLKTIEFADKAAFTSSSAVRSVYYAAYYDILSGIPNGDGTFRYEPKGNAERQHAAKVIYQLLAAIENFEQPPVEPTPEPKPEPTPPPTPPVDPNVFQIATIKNGELVKETKTYTDYNTAAEAFKNSTAAQGLYKGNELIRIKSGLAYADHAKRDVTRIYPDTTFNKHVTYVEPGRELRYIDANEQYVKVQAGGTIGYAKHSEVGLVPLGLVKERDHYIKSQWGTILHYIYNYHTKKLAFYYVGPGPDKMTSGVKYYSHDGVHFSNEKGELQFTYYPYFQYQSIRTKTNYTAEELDKYILDKLTYLESLDPYSYKDATKRSKLVGIGKTLKQVEADYKVNALFTLGVSINESGWGLSKHALEGNNLFGLAVYDSNPSEGDTFATRDDSVITFARNYINTKYLNPNGSYPNGAAPGNKTTGVNVMYASDPTWGAKAAGHMWQIDNELGGKDLGKNQLGITTTSAALNVRSAPDSNASNIIYTYRAKDLGFNDGFGYPVVIVDEAIGTDGKTWYKILSDLPTHEFGWIHSAYVKKIMY